MAHDVVIDGARFLYQVSAVQMKIFTFFGLRKVRHGLQSLFKHFEECKGVFGRAKIAVKHIIGHFSEKQMLRWRLCKRVSFRDIRELRKW